MGTSSITASSAGNSPTAPLTFNGVSTFSSDFQSILTRAVGIASLPLTALQNSDADVLSRQTELQSVGQSIASLTSSFTSLTSAVSTGATQASSSDSTVVTATATGAASAGSFTVNSITSLAAAESETSLTGYASSTAATVSSTGSLQLVIGSNPPFNITLAAGQNNLNGLVNAITALHAGVTASVLTTGNATNPDYLSITADTPGQNTIQLIDDPTGANRNLLTSLDTGTDAVFQLNGITVHRQSNTVNDLVPGLSFSLQATSTTPQTITLAASTTSLSTALGSFVTAYNGVQNQLSGETGKGGGSLGGSDVILQASDLLRQIAGYHSSGSASSSSIQSLSDVGVSFDATGQASFDPTVLSGLNDAQINSAFTFIGTATTGFGSVGNSLSQLSDPVTGLIQAQQASYTATDTRLKSQINDLQARITNLQTATQSRLAKFDTLIATLQSQQTVLAASIQSVNLALFGQNQTSPA
jgi:flagellar hook-associated protein 2